MMQRSASTCENKHIGESRTQGVTAQSRRVVAYALLVGLGLGLTTVWDSQAAGQSLSSDRSMHTGALVARLTIPRLRTQWFVTSVSNADALRGGPGHVAGTTFPGETGNAVIAGRCDTHFNALQSVREGDDVVVETSTGQFRYRVIETAVVPSGDPTVLGPSDKPLLTLVTCYPFNMAERAARRFIVRAELTRPGTFA